jgi:hypothetical protein
LKIFGEKTSIKSEFEVPPHYAIRLSADIIGYGEDLPANFV